MKSNLRVLWRGFLRAFSGTAVSALFAVAGIGFSRIPGKDGYGAVILCAAAGSILALAIISLFKLGGGKSAARSGKFSK